MSDEDKKADINRRDRERSHIIKKGKLIFGGFSPSVVDCLMIDISDSGVRVETSIMVQVPDIFTLESNGSKRPVRRAWARGNQIGLEFLD